MRDDESTSSEDMIRRARESLEEPTAKPPELADTGADLEIDEAEIDAIVAAELEPEDDETQRPTARPPRPTPRLGPPGEVMPSGPDPFADAPADERRGFVFAVGAALIGAVAWAALLAYAEMQSWLLGIGIGWLIGTAAINGAGRFTTRLKVGVALLAIASVVVGEVLGVALLWNKEFGFFDLPLAAEFYFENLDQLRNDFLFALGGGAFGAWTAIAQGSNPRNTRPAG